MNKYFKIFSIFIVLIMVTSGLLIVISNEKVQNNIQNKKINNENNSVTNSNITLPINANYIIPVSNSCFIVYNNPVAINNPRYVHLYNLTTNKETRYFMPISNYYSSNSCFFPFSTKTYFYFGFNLWTVSGGVVYGNTQIEAFNILTHSFTDIYNTAYDGYRSNVYFGISYIGYEKSNITNNWIYINQLPYIIMLNSTTNKVISVTNVNNDGFNPNSAFTFINNNILGYYTGSAFKFYVYIGVNWKIFSYTTSISLFSYAIVNLYNYTLNVTFNKFSITFHFNLSTYTIGMGNTNLPIGDKNYFLPYQLNNYLKSKYGSTYYNNIYNPPDQAFSYSFIFQYYSGYIKINSGYAIVYFDGTNRILLTISTLYDYLLTINSYELGNKINNYGLINGALFTGKFSQTISFPFSYLPLNYSGYEYSGKLISVTDNDFTGKGSVRYYNLSIFYISAGATIQPLQTQYYYTPLVYLFVILLIPAFTIFVYKFRRELKNIRGIKYA